MVLFEDDFWSETIRMDGDGDGFTWSWTWISLALVLFVFTFRRVRRSRLAGSAISPTITTTAAMPDSVSSYRTPEIISDLDLKNLIKNLDVDSSDAIWDHVIDKRNSSMSYTAKCCKPKDGPLKYLSVTTFEDCSAEELLKFYMDNQYRVQWDKTVVHYESLKVDEGCGIEIGRIIKKFPLLTPRDYVLAWKLWQGVDGSFYCFSKECEHPLAPKEKKYVRVATFRSGWRISKVPGRNAAEIRVVHQEDAGLKVEMAKIAFAKGIWKYVCKMDDALRKYSDRKQHQFYSTTSGCMSIQKVPPEFEAINTTVNPENTGTTVSHNVETCKSNTRRRLTKRPSNKLIANGLVLIGGAICLSRGHSSLGAKIALAYILSKVTKRQGIQENPRDKAS